MGYTVAPKRLNTGLPHSPAIPLTGTYPKKVYPLLTAAAWFIRAKCPSTNRQKVLCCTWCPQRGALFGFIYKEGHTDTHCDLDGL